MDDDQSWRLLSLLSHELRSPLGVIRGYLRLLDQQGTELTEQHRHAVTAALAASERAADLLSQASTLAQLQRHETTFDLKPIALQTVLAAAVAGVRLPEDPRVGIEPPEVPMVLVVADEELLGGALRALVFAVARAQASETMLRIAVRLEPSDGTTGAAITIAPAHTSPAATAERLNIGRGGLGLDLPIAESLVVSHGGQVRELRDGERFGGVVVWLPTTS